MRGGPLPERIDLDPSGHSGVGGTLGNALTGWREVHGIGYVDRRGLQEAQTWKTTNMNAADKLFQHQKDLMGQQTVQRVREQNWKYLPRDSKLARTLYPGLADADTRKAQASFAAGEGKRPPAQQKLLSDRERAYQSPLGGQSKWSK